MSPLPTPRDPHSVLVERARRLAHPDRSRDERPGLDVLRVQFGEERYAFPCGFVRAVYALASLSPMPCLPKHFAGMLNARGRILPVVDLAKLLDLPRVGLGDWHRVVHLAFGEIQVGVLAASLVELAVVQPASLQAALAAQLGAGHEFFQGVTPDGVALFDVRKLLQDPRLVVNEEVA